MAKSAQFSETIALGKKLVEEFSNDEYRNDITIRWMAHYLADLMKQAEQEKDSDKRKLLQQECIDIILRLWEKRAAFPKQATPLGRLHSAISILVALNEDDDRVSWRRRRLFETDDRWGRFMQQLRETFEQLMNLALIVNVTEPVLIKEKEWLDNGKFLSDEEKKLIDQLDKTLRRMLPVQIVFVSDSKAVVKDAPRFEQALSRMTELVQENLNAIRRLQEGLDTGREIATVRASKQSRAKRKVTRSKKGQKKASKPIHAKRKR